MKSNMSVNPSYFQFSLFADYGSLRYLFFSLCLLIYMTIISANVVIVLAVFLDKSLHQPMYIFICCLSVNSLYGSAAFFPRFLMDIVSDDHFIPRAACFTQVYVISTSAAQDLALLTIMAYDRFVAICQPLHYHSKMTAKTVLCLIIISVLYPAIVIGMFLYHLGSAPFCENKLQKIFCSNWSLVQLLCEDTTVNNITGQTLTAAIIALSLSFVLYTYLRILLVCSRSSSEIRGKALQTCLPHIVSLLNYCISFYCEFALTRLRLDKKNTLVVIVLSLEYLIIPPINNPLVYGLSLPQIRGVIFRRFKV
ncbi:putative gustatory receptor clone PTE03 [Cheilinus undulatus]|uniref:putative gustatory receptor clone PTE03 n=1 Tax=Cheilinus undulatus TaxID=241271 RepID=UPI001BD50BCD|nr:putative gustatory receptor clone PTE03 [Cheilinus undulatus]